MEHAVAVNMIQNGVDGTTPGLWADLGAGEGVFTCALAHLLGDGSMIYAIDRDAKALKSIPDLENNITIKKLKLDFIKENIPLNPLDGLLMANSLHFANDKITLLQKLKKILKPNGRFIMVEYDTKQASPWIPYPVNFDELQDLMRDVGFTEIVKLHETPSSYNPANLYSARIRY